jgi:L,D-transpeptidase YcbB
MERWRWLPRELGIAYVMVNVPDYTLKVINQQQAVWSTRIVVGRPGQYATPLLAETVKNITINPTWNVPPSIIRNEYLPALERDPNSLARIGLKIERDRDGSIHIYQPPSERNALGRIRFNFPNRFLVYQHDTPNKNLFQKMGRAYSHGCMRVESPDKYAEVLLSISQPEEGHSVERIRALYSTSEQTIDLKNPIPVTYQTAFVDDSGQLQKRLDIYDLDQVVTNLLKRDREIVDISLVRNHGTTKKLLAYFPKRDREVADIPSSRHYGRTNKLTARLPIKKKKPRIAEPHFGWVSTWGWNYFEDRRSAYAPFNQFRSW